MRAGAGMTEGFMDSSIRKRSVTIAGHSTSVSLEAAFWDALKDIATARGVSINALIEAIDEGRTGNLSSAIRVFVLAEASKGAVLKVRKPPKGNDAVRLLDPESAAFGLFLTAWCGYTLIMDHLACGLWGVNQHLKLLRDEWMKRMLDRENRIMDTALVGHTIHSVTFFASTSMLVLAGLVGLLGAVDDGSRHAQPVQLRDAGLARVLRA